MTLLLAALSILICGGALAAALARWPRAASAVGAGAAVLGCAAGAMFAVSGLRGDVTSAVFAWRVPSGGIVLACDALSAFFLLPLFALGALAAVYGRDYLLAHRDHKSLGVPWLAFNVLLASMATVVTARHAVLFLVAWEVMTLSSYILVVFEHEHAEVGRAGWVYLIAAHLGTMFLFAMFLLLEASTGTFVFGAGQAALGGASRALILCFALVGFGVKAGLVPLHVWLPEAHAAAPSHVSALMSGVLTKMGVYGILRVAVLAGPTPVWWGHLLILAGLVSALSGVALAIYQRDIKRVLAYSTIENVGLVTLGLGLGFWGVASGHPVIAAAGFWGGFLHAWNHTAMKGLLFLGAGTIAHGTGTKDIERLGGLMRRAPMSSALFFIGSIAIAGLPPLNGFVGEWLLYRSLLGGAGASAPGPAIGFMLAVGALSAVGALAALCFVRLCGAALLGQPRSAGAASAHEASPGMLLPMGVLCLLTVFLGARPRDAAAAISAAVERVMPLDRAAESSLWASLTPLGHAAVVGWSACLLAALIVLWMRRGRPALEGPTWGCGYAAPTARMQYTGRSFSQLFADLLPKALRSRIDIVRPSGLFPAPGELTSRSDDPITRGVYEPVLDRAADRFARLRWLQQGALHIYVLYILVALVAGLTWTTLGGWAGR